MTQPTMDYPPGATPLDPEEMEGLRFKHVATRAQLDELEQANIQTGLLWLARRLRRKPAQAEILSDAFAATLHKRLFGDVWHWAGTFRRTEKNIGIDPHYISVELRKLMDDAHYWLENRTYAPLEAALRLHHRMVLIHPFPNGNGRHARIMADILLHLQNAPAIDWAGGHDLQRIGPRRQAYIAALRAADRGDIAPLLGFATVD